MPNSIDIFPAIEYLCPDFTGLEVFFWCIFPELQNLNREKTCVLQTKFGAKKPLVTASERLEYF